MSELVADRVVAGYRHQVVLRGVTASFAPGMHIMIGPNGAGKTTLLRLLAGVLTPSAGTVTFDGRPLDPELKRAIGFVGHRAGLIPRLSVRDNLEYAACLLGMKAPARADALERVVHEVPIAGLLARRASRLSRGEQQRVAIARALMGDPSVLLLDEPLAGLDPDALAMLRALLHDLASAGRTVVVSTHQLRDVEDLGGAIVGIRDGQLALAVPAEMRKRRSIRGRVVLRGVGPIRESLSRLGRTVTADPGGGAIVEVQDEEDVALLVERLVGDGVRLFEVTSLERPLEAAYDALGRDA